MGTLERVGSAVAAGGENLSVTFMLCDDSEEERGALSRALQDYAARRGLEFRLETASGAGELLGRWAPSRWDAVFLDIFMPGLSGADAARRLRAMDPNLCLIFATASREHGMFSYDIRVTDYLLKPFAQQDIDDALDYFLESHAENLRSLRVRTAWEEFDVRFRDIRYIEIRNHRAILHTREQELTVWRSLDELEEEMRDERFLRCHRSFLVNLEHVKAPEKRDFLMDCGDLAPVSRQKVQIVQRRYQEWLAGRTLFSAS